MAYSPRMARSPRIATNLERMAANRFVAIRFVKKISWYSWIILFVAISGILFGGIRGVQAAEISFNPSTLEIGIGQVLPIKVLLDTDGENINAIGAEIQYPQEFLKLKDLSEGNSIVNFWVDNPRIATNKDTNSSEIIFSGIIPGGYQGKDGLLLTLYFEAIKEGRGTISFLGGTRILLNDGKGTTDGLKTNSLEFVAIRDKFVAISGLPLKDTELPESFAPEISRDELVANGKWFVVFATQDKASGIDRYEIRESRQRFFAIFQRWSQAESPYILQDQELRSYVFVKAVDKTGNERIMEINPQNLLAWYENYENWIIIILLGIVIAYVIKKFLWKIIH